MQDDKNRKNSKDILFPSDENLPDTGLEELNDALLEADEVIAEALRRRELEEAIAETDREVAELAAQRRQAGSRRSVPDDSSDQAGRTSGPDDNTAQTGRSSDSAEDSGPAASRQKKQRRQSGRIHQSAVPPTSAETFFSLFC